MCIRDRLVAVAVNALVWLLVAVMLLKLLLFLSASNAACRLLSAYLTAAYPDITAWLLLMLLLIASARGARSAATRLAARA